MPAKYSHTKKRPPGHSKKSNSSIKGVSSKDHRTPNPQVDRSISQAMSAVSQMERAIARILLIRFEQDIARLFSTHLYCVALLQLPTLVMRCTNVSGPGWVAANADCDEIKDFFRSVIGMDLRQAGERVATKSVLWSYTALRHFVCHDFVSNKTPPLTSYRQYQIMSRSARSAASTPFASCPIFLLSKPTWIPCKLCRLRLSRSLLT